MGESDDLREGFSEILGRRQNPLVFIQAGAVCLPVNSEAISKRVLGLNIGVGASWPILKILSICLRLTTSARLDLEPD
jgi:hypothetical protein